MRKKLFRVQFLTYWVKLLMEIVINKASLNGSFENQLKSVNFPLIPENRVGDARCTFGVN